MKTKKLKTKKLTIHVDPTQGAARLATSIAAPEGYRFFSMDRKGSKAVITYVELK